jgi:ABC-2 type transport system ATP-binding protein
VRAFDVSGLAADLARAGYSVTSGADDELVVTGATSADVGAVAAAGGHVLSELRPLQRGLEDVFFSLTDAAA